MAYLVLDIETIRDTSLPALDDPEAFPPPPYHEAVVIGAMWMDAAFHAQRLACLPGDEPAMLARFASILEQHTPTLVTWNGRGFDLPVIAMRSLKHGVPQSAYYRERDYRYRFSASHHIDLKDQLTDHGAGMRSSLDVVAKMLGLPGKGDVCGADVGALWAAGEHDRVRAYCLDDVAQTARVFLRWCCLTGRLPAADVAARDAEIAALVSALEVAA